MDMEMRYTGPWRGIVTATSSTPGHVRLKAAFLRHQSIASDRLSGTISHCSTRTITCVSSLTGIMLWSRSLRKRPSNLAMPPGVSLGWCSSPLRSKKQTVSHDSLTLPNDPHELRRCRPIRQAESIL
jgi:4'-phosphopantetheinyl transferase EntD